jgi:uncharacterized protein (TIGR01732 family)
MKQHVILLTALITLVPRVNVPAVQTDHSPSVRQVGRLEIVGKKSKGPKAKRGTLEDRIRHFAERVLRMDDEEVDQFMGAASVAADFLGVDLQDGGGSYAGGFVLILVLFILLIIVGAGFGFGRG